MGYSSLRPYRGTILATLLIALCYSLSADASIIVPEPQEFASESGGAGACGGNTSRGEPDRDVSVKKLRLLSAFPPGSGSSGSGTSAPFSGFGGGAGVTSALASTAFSASEREALTGRICREARLFIPLPPVDFLLRPPEIWM